MMMAGIDGIKQQDRAAGADRQGPLRAAAGRGHGHPAGAGVAWRRSSTALEEDHDYLLEGGVFTPDLIETWIDFKRTNEIDPLRLRPHPYEFALYYDV